MLSMAKWKHVRHHDPRDQYGDYIAKPEAANTW